MKQLSGKIQIVDEPINDNYHASKMTLYIDDETFVVDYGSKEQERATIQINLDVDQDIDSADDMTMEELITELEEIAIDTKEFMILKHAFRVNNITDVRCHVATYDDTFVYIGFPMADLVRILNAQ